MSMDTIINDTTEWNPTREVGQGQGQPAAQAQTQEPAPTPARASMQAQTIQIPAKRLEFWIQVAQLAVLVLIMLRQ